MLFSFTTTKTLNEETDCEECVATIQTTPTYKMLHTKVEELAKELQEEKQARLELEQRYMQLQQQQNPKLTKV